MNIQQIDKQELLDKRYLRMATIWAENSYCQRRKVGAIIVKDQMDTMAHLPDLRTYAKMKQEPPSPTSFMPKPMPSQKWPEATTAAIAQLYMLPHRHVWNAPNL